MWHQHNAKHHADIGQELKIILTLNKSVKKNLMSVILTVEQLLVPETDGLQGVLHKKSILHRMVQKTKTKAYQVKRLCRLKHLVNKKRGEEDYQTDLS